MRLELTRRADYALRAMLALAQCGGETVSGAAIARTRGISPYFITQVMGDLVRAGLVEARVGRSGGYRLARSAADISVLAVVEAIEGDSRRRSCVLRTAPCRSDEPCAMHEIFTQAQNALIERLSRSTVADAVRR
jgi:cysteine desulfurase